jgi:hypothetical protein
MDRHRSLMHSARTASIHACMHAVLEPGVPAVTGRRGGHCPARGTDETLHRSGGFFTCTVSLYLYGMHARARVQCTYDQSDRKFMLWT